MKDSVSLYQRFQNLCIRLLTGPFTLTEQRSILVLSPHNINLRLTACGRIGTSPAPQLSELYRGFSLKQPLTEVLLTNFLKYLPPIIRQVWFHPLISQINRPRPIIERFSGTNRYQKRKRLSSTTYMDLRDPFHRRASPFEPAPEPLNFSNKQYRRRYPLLPCRRFPPCGKRQPPQLI